MTPDGDVFNPGNACGVASCHAVGTGIEAASLGRIRTREGGGCQGSVDPETESSGHGASGSPGPPCHPPASAVRWHRAGQLQGRGSSLRAGVRAPATQRRSLAGDGAHGGLAERAGLRAPGRCRLSPGPRASSADPADPAWPAFATHSPERRGEKCACDRTCGALL